MASGWKSFYFRYKDFFLNISALYKKRADLRAFLEIMLSIAAVIIFLVFALKPTALTIISLVQQIKQEKQVLSSLTQKVNNLKKANEILTQDQNYLSDINIAVSSYPAPEILFKQVEGLSAKNDVSLIGLSINDVYLVGTNKNKIDKENPLPENSQGMEFSISIRGNFTNVFNFIENFEKMRMVSTIDTLTISSYVTDEEKSIIAVISGRVPYLFNN